MYRPIGAALILTLSLPIGARATERMTDEQVKKQIQDISAGFETWKESLEKRNLDDAVITSAERTVKIKDFLKDFEKAIEVLESRFKPEYAASPEVVALLRRGSDVELRNRRQGLTPDSTWTALGSKLEALARAYEIPWPVESMNAQATRLNDAELAARVEKLAKAAQKLRDEADKAVKANKSIDKATRASLKSSIERMETMAKDVGSRIRDDMPASVEVGQLLAQAGKVKETMAKLSVPSQPSWPAIQSGLEALARAFALPIP